MTMDFETFEEGTMSDKKKLEIHDLNQLEQTAKGLFNSFWWESTEEGYDYWAEVYNKLVSIAYSARTGEPRKDVGCTAKPVTRTLAGR